MSADEERRNGAIACRAAILDLIAHAHTEYGSTMVDYIDWQMEGAAEFARALSSMPPFTEGVLLTLAEIVHITEAGSYPALSPRWTPYVAMTEGERAAFAAEAQARMDEDEAPSNAAAEQESDTTGCAPSNVVAFPRRAVRGCKKLTEMFVAGEIEYAIVLANRMDGSTEYLAIGDAPLDIPHVTRIDL